MAVIGIQRLTETAKAPTYGSEHAAGMDLYSDMSARWGLFPLERRLVPTGLAVAIPPGHYGRVAPRSGLAFKSGIDVLAGVIDSDYRGHLQVVLINLSDYFVSFEPQERIAQFIITPYSRCYIVDALSLPDTERGAGGFGSTGAE